MRVQKARPFGSLWVGIHAAKPDAGEADLDRSTVEKKKKENSLQVMDRNSCIYSQFPGALPALTFEWRVRV